MASCLLLWWQYDFSVLVADGYEPERTALIQVAEMGCIVAALAVTARFFHGRSNCQRSAVKAGCSLSWKTALLLFGYGLLVMLWRESWTPARGISDYAMFLPVLGVVNARFFSEVGWIIYLVELLPMVSVIAAIVYGAEVRLTSGPQSSHRR
jgi:hypothetical protein